MVRGTGRYLRGPAIAASLAASVVVSACFFPEQEAASTALSITLVNVPTELLVIPGGFHGFDRVAPESAAGRGFTAARLNALRRAFGMPVVL